MNQDDQALIDAVGRGDASAFEQIYRAHKDVLLTATIFVLGGDCSGAEDVLHDVFVRFAEHARDVRLKTGLRAYLMASCINRARDVLRRRMKNLQFDTPLIDHAEYGNDPVAMACATEESARVMEALLKLTEEQREVMTLRTCGALRFREIAAVLGISLDTVKSRYRYALSRLQQTLATEESAKEKES